MRPHLIASFVLLSSVAHADLELPRPSPNAKVGVSVGLTDILVEYSSPAVKGRKIWGGLVPNGEVWRTGANNATKISFTKDVVIADKPIAAGAYGLYTIPNATSWTIILSKDVDKSGLAYKKEDDVLRFDVKPTAGTMHEHLTFGFPDFDANGATLALDWEKVHVSFAIKAKTAEQVAAGIKNLNELGQRPYANAARYLLDSKGDTTQAMTLVDQSLAIKEDWFNDWVKAQLQHEKKDAGACATLAKADKLGQATPATYFAAPDVKKQTAEWKCK